MTIDQQKLDGPIDGIEQVEQNSSQISANLQCSLTSRSEQNYQDGQLGGGGGGGCHDDVDDDDDDVDDGGIGRGGGDGDDGRIPLFALFSGNMNECSNMRQI